MTSFAVLKPNDVLLKWIGDRIDAKHGVACFDPEVTRSTILFDNNGVPIVATAIDGWTDHSCDMTIASDGTKRWATRKFICGTYDWVFRTCGKNRISMITAVDNVPAMKMQVALGHVQEGLHRDYFGPGLDAASFSFLRRDWEASRWFGYTNKTTQ